MERECLDVIYKVVGRDKQPRGWWNKSNSNEADVIWLAKFEKDGGGTFFAKIAERVAPRHSGNFTQRCNRQDELKMTFCGRMFAVWSYRGRMYCKPSC